MLRKNIMKQDQRRASDGVRFDLLQSERLGKPFAIR